VDELRTAGIRALADLGTSLLEVTGSVVVRRTQRLSDFANFPDPMMDVSDASARTLHVDGAEPFEDSETLSLNRDRVLVMIPVEDEHPGAHHDLKVLGRRVGVRIICRAVQVTGFVNLPVNATLSTFIHERHSRFIAVNGARILPISSHASVQLTDFAVLHEFCLVNRDYVIACIEAPPSSSDQADV